MSSLQVTNDFIFVGVSQENHIHRYNHNGHLLQIHGLATDRINLLCPNICDKDADGQILIADEAHARLLMLSPKTGEWKLMPKLNVKHFPHHAVVKGNRLFVHVQWFDGPTSSSRMLIAKYTMKSGHKVHGYSLPHFVC